MQSEILSNIEKFNEQALGSAKHLGDIQLRALGKLAERQIAAAADCLDGGVRQLALLGETKDVQTAMQEQTRLASDISRKLVEHARMTAEAMAETRDDLAQWMRAGMQAAGEAGKETGTDKAV